MINPHALPDTPVDFRRFAPQLVRSEDLEATLRSSLDAEVVSRALIIGGDVLPASMQIKREPSLWIETGIEAARKAAADPDVLLSPDEDAALEAVVRLQERPALLVRRSSFPEPPDRWIRLNQFRGEICEGLPGVGRIDSHLGAMVGTGFLVAADLVMTNRHVVEAFASPPPSEDGSWVIFASERPTIDFRMEYSEPERRVFVIEEIIAVHADLDLALIRVAREATEPAGAPLPIPLKLAGSSPDIASPLDLYAVGYPWTDNGGVTPPELIASIYDGIFKVKRLQPGQFMSLYEEAVAFSHDCSTLGGNSGSSVVDLRANQVIGLHFKGTYRRANYAVALWKLNGDPLFHGLGLNYSA